MIYVTELKTKRNLMRWGVLMMLKKCTIVWHKGSRTISKETTYFRLTEVEKNWLTLIVSYLFTLHSRAEQPLKEN